MPVIAIETDGDPRIADYRNVPDAELLHRRGLFVAEGRLVVRRLLEESPLVPRSIMATAPALESIADLATSRPDLPVYLVAQPTMDGVTGFNVHRGCLAVGERPTPGPWMELASSAQTLVVLEGIGNADNVGGVFRNARALGANAVLLGPGCANPLYRKAIRTSMGAALLVPFANASPWPEALVALRDAGVAVVAMTPVAGARPLHEVVAGLRGARAALLFGHEGEGLTPGAMNACDHLARVPMNGFDSLNVASASAIGLYEWMRRP